MICIYGWARVEYRALKEKIAKGNAASPYYDALCSGDNDKIKAAIVGHLQCAVSDQDVTDFKDHVLDKLIEESGKEHENLIDSVVKVFPLCVRNCPRTPDVRSPEYQGLSDDEFVALRSALVRVVLTKEDQGSQEIRNAVDMVARQVSYMVAEARGVTCSHS